MVIYEDTRGKTKYKLVQNTTDVVGTFNGNNYYIVAIYEYSYKLHKYCTDDTLRNLYLDSYKFKKKFDILNFIEWLIKLFE